MNTNNEIKSELGEIAPFLATLKDKKNGFTVPKDHFSKLQYQIFDQLKDETPILTVKKKFSIWDYAWLKPAVAAVFVGAVGATIFFWNANKSTSINQKMADISSDEMENYISSHIDEFDVELIVKNNPGILDETFKDFKPEDIHQYLKESIDDIEIEDLENL